MKRSIVAMIMMLFLLVGCGSQGEEAQESATTNKGSTAAQTILFFLNPNGRPCKMQDTILKHIDDKLKAKNVKVQYVSTHKMERDGPLFQRYGIRMLPTIIVLDKNGKEKKRLPAGVQGQEILLNAIK